MIGTHWMDWLIALLCGAMVGGVAWLTNRVVFCMATFLYFYANIVQDISTSNNPPHPLEVLLGIIPTISILQTPTSHHTLEWTYCTAEFVIPYSHGHKDPNSRYCNASLQHIPVVSSSRSHRVTAVGRKIDSI